MAPINRHSIRQRVLRQIETGSRTTGEVAAMIGIDAKVASAHLCNLARRRQVIRHHVFTRPGEPGGRRIWWEPKA